MKQGFFARHSYILLFCIICMICFSVVFCFFLNNDVKNKEEQLALLNEKYENIIQDNEELNYLLNDADEKELFEELARSHGYSYPDEKIYIDITPGK